MPEKAPQIIKQQVRIWEYNQLNLRISLGINFSVSALEI